MEERAAIPPGLPRPNPTISYWQSPPDEIADHRSSEKLPLGADVVVIGSGITGASIAYNILKDSPDSRVVMLEARQAASGASGRNGGHTKAASYRTFLANIGRVGKEDAVKIARLEYDCIVAVHDFARTHNIDCDSRRLDTADIIYDEEKWVNANETVALMQELMGNDDPAARYEFYDSAETASRFLTPGAVGSISYEAGSLSAYKLTIGILKLALEKGLKLHCNTPVQMAGRVCHEEQFEHWVLTTPRGLITAQKVIHATNGYTAHLMTSLQGVIVPLRGFVTAQRPGKCMPANGLDHTYSFIYKKGFEYLIPRPKGTKFDGDIIIGGGLTKTTNDGIGEYGNTDDTTLNEDILHYLNGSTETFFGENWGEDDPEGRIRMAWSGIMGYSADGHPLVGKMPQPGLYIAASFQGHGMVNCFLCAKALVAMLLDKDDEELDRWFPRAYRMSEKRLKSKFRSKLHATETAKVGQPNGVGGGTSHR